MRMMDGGLDKHAYDTARIDVASSLYCLYFSQHFGIYSLRPL